MMEAYAQPAKQGIILLAAAFVLQAIIFQIPVLSPALLVAASLPIVKHALIILIAPNAPLGLLIISAQHALPATLLYQAVMSALGTIILVLHTAFLALV